METPTTYSGLVALIIDFINLLIPALFSLLFLYLLWKIIDSWIVHADDETKRQEGKRYAILAVIAFVVMVSVWGIVRLFSESLFG